MLYSNLLVAAAAFFSFASAQNSTATPVGPCCNVDPGSIDSDLRADWCRAERNTCPEVCGGISKLQQGGNDCNAQTLNFTCVCSDGTRPNMSEYQQSVPGLMCRQWFENCIAASGEDLEKQEACKSVECGNKTTRAAASSSAAASDGPTATGGGGDQASATAGSPTSAQSSGAATALAIARDYGTPVLAAGMMALFGFAL
ncbi:hypothetical protein K469DRAFT_708387 [Zopfia rhizophila CBS 207.26]|uniref:DUF7707 domain-containing protein n=1 Tax=Zopfia rhizophila CBS 207.26 TaxID=1314779 RepID=A0A6A6DZW5_9PEZI|nr:hypothetical protein K469DRAFT_708387 [Zopfia rhizophila CBS 207.26]